MNQGSCILSVSYHIIIEHYYNNHIIHISALLEFLVSEISTILLVYPLPLSISFLISELIFDI